MALLECSVAAKKKVAFVPLCFLCLCKHRLAVEMHSWLLGDQLLWVQQPLTVHEKSPWRAQTGDVQCFHHEYGNKLTVNIRGLAQADKRANEIGCHLQ